MDPATEVDPPVALREEEILAGGLANGAATEDTETDPLNPNTEHTHADLCLMSLKSPSIMNAGSVTKKVTTLKTVWRSNEHRRSKQTRRMRNRTPIWHRMYRKQAM